jgi:hypothetical protein
LSGNGDCLDKNFACALRGSGVGLETPQVNVVVVVVVVVILGVGALGVTK